MEREKILIADDEPQCVNEMVRLVGRDHEIVGTAGNVQQVKDLLDKGVCPTVAFLDNRFPCDGDGERAAALIKELSPKTTVVVISGDSVNWGDYYFSKGCYPGDIIDFLLKLEH